MQNKKILIADDVEMNRDLLREILEDDYQVETVEDGEKAISVLSERIDEYAVLRSFPGVCIPTRRQGL